MAKITLYIIFQEKYTFKYKIVTINVTIKNKYKKSYNSKFLRAKN